MIRHGAKLVHAFAEATVPKITVVLRKAFGGAFIAMNSRDLGADYVFAWPQRPARRDGRQAGRRRSSTGATSRPPTTPRPCATSSPSAYADEHLTAGIAAAEGYVDEVIPPSDTRRRLAEALSTLDAIASPDARSEEHPAMSLNWSAVPSRSWRPDRPSPPAGARSPRPTWSASPRSPATGTRSTPTPSGRAAVRVRRAHRPRAARALAGGRARPVRPRARGRAAARRATSSSSARSGSATRSA